MMTDSDAPCISFCYFLSEIMVLYKKECYARQQIFCELCADILWCLMTVELTFWTVTVTTTQLLHINNCYLSL